MAHDPGDENDNITMEEAHDYDTSDVVKIVEKKYPVTTEAFKQIQKEQYEIFCAKQNGYGPDNISLGTSLQTKDQVRISLVCIFIRMNDKIQRMKNMLLGTPEERIEAANVEPLEDTYIDISNYAIIARIVKSDRWGK